MGEYFFDPGITIKEETSSKTPKQDLQNVQLQMQNTMNISASVPIPSKRIDISDYCDLQFDSADANDSSSKFQDFFSPTEFVDATNTMWSTKLLDMDLVPKMESQPLQEEDDIFQVDKSDLIQGSSMGEIDCSEEILFADLNFDDLMLPEETATTYLSNLSPQKSLPNTQQNNNNNNNDMNSLNNNTNNVFATSCPQTSGFFFKDISFSANSMESLLNKASPNPFTPSSAEGSNSALFPQASSSPLTALQLKHTTLHGLLKQDSPFGSSERSLSVRETPPGPSSPVPVAARIMQQQKVSSQQQNSRLSSSAPTHLGLWQRREPRPHLLSTGSQVEAGSTSSLSTGGVLSPEAPDFSHDELESDEDSDHYDDFSTDGDSDDDDADPNHTSSKSAKSKKERFFWQYNVQSKGPKGQRLMLKTKTENPHVLNEITDPVFSPDCAVRGIKHSGKARKGDGNDLTPNPKKLYSIGKELDKLGKIINDMTPVSELPFNVRPKTRKEKNKLASRACRLKKKAQHEANKIKLEGLEQEHKRLINLISQAKHIFSIKLRENSNTDKQKELSGHMEKIYKSTSKCKIAGQTTEYVNKILDKIRAGGQPIMIEDIM